jgi:hypothetical protein
MRRALVAVPIAVDSGGNVGYTAVYTTLGEGWTLDPAARAETRLRGLAL